MNIEMTLQRQPTLMNRVTFGEWKHDQLLLCNTLEDKIREIPGMPVASWKVPGRTAIPQGRYELVMEDSPKFGKGTLTLVGVPGFLNIRVHSVYNEDDTEGCIGVGDTPNREKGTMSGGLAHHVLDHMKELIAGYLLKGDRVFLTISNPA